MVTNSTNLAMSSICNIRNGSLLVSGKYIGKGQMPEEYNVSAKFYDI